MDKLRFCPSSTMTAACCWLGWCGMSLKLGFSSGHMEMLTPPPGLLLGLNDGSVLALGLRSRPAHRAQSSSWEPGGVSSLLSLPKTASQRPFPFFLSTSPVHSGKPSQRLRPQHCLMVPNPVSQLSVTFAGSSLHSILLDRNVGAFCFPGGAP